MLARSCPLPCASDDRSRGGNDRRPRRTEAPELPAGEALVSIRSDDPAKLAAARAAVDAIVAGFAQRHFAVSDNLVGALMGKGGERIAKLQVGEGGLQRGGGVQSEMRNRCRWSGAKGRIGKEREG